MKIIKTFPALMLYLVLLCLTLISCNKGAGSDNGGTTVPGSSLAEKLEWLNTNAKSDTSYTFEVIADESITPQFLNYDDKSGITISLSGKDSNRVIGLLYNGTLFRVGSGVTLELNGNIVLQGRDSNTNPLIYIERGGTLSMNTGSVITGNTNTAAVNAGNYGGGVFVHGTFDMSGGTITGNTASGGSVYGGGVFIEGPGTFNMSGGSITGNNASGGNANDGSGGGVYVFSFAFFTMSGGSISNNTASGGTGAFGGGVNVYSSNFRMSDGTINGNTANSGSAGYGYGGGVFVSDGSFAMDGGSITSNVASISYRDSSISGGGVFVSGGYFAKTGGTISGNVVRNSSGNVANKGHAIYARRYVNRRDVDVKRKETSVGPENNLSYVGTTDPSTFSGAWDN